MPRASPDISVGSIFPIEIYRILTEDGRPYTPRRIAAAATSYAEGLRENGHENIARKTEPVCRNNHERGRRQSRLSGRGFARYCGHAAAGRGESIRDYLRHIGRRY
jgi:hypothetical protein